MSQNKNEKLIVRKDKKDGTSEIIITKSPSKTIFGKILIAVLAGGMVLTTVVSLLIVILQAAGLLK